MGAPRRLRATTAVAAVATSMAMIIPTTAAVADPGVLVVTGTASLPVFPSPVWWPGSFSGQVLGTSSGAALANFYYSETTCALGYASGTLNAAGHGSSFLWYRLGATAVVTLNGPHLGSAIASFSIDGPTPIALAAACVPGGNPVAVAATVTAWAMFV